MKENYWTKRRPYTRRGVLAAGAGGGAGLIALATIGCGDDDDGGDIDQPTQTQAPGATSAPTSSSDVTMGGTLTQISDADPPNLNAVHEVTTRVHGILAASYNSVIRQLSDGTVAADLADSWEDPEPGQYIFHLNPEAKWHDGTPFTGEDIQATWGYILQDDTPAGLHSRKVDYLVDVDPAKLELSTPQTLSVTLSQPRASFLDSVSVSWMVVGPKHVLDDDPAILNTSIVGTGPFKFDSYTPGSLISLKKNPEYFRAGLPYLDEIATLLALDSATIRSVLEGGRAQLAGATSALTIQAAEQLSSSSDFNVEFTTDFGHACLYPNCSREPFSDPRVRRAMFLAIDRPLAIEVLAEGRGALGTYISPGAFSLSEQQVNSLPGFRTGDEKEQDLVEARELLDQAGFGSGISGNIMLRSPGAEWEAWAIFVQDQWKKIGVDLNIQPTETAAFNSRRRELDFDVYVGAGTSRESGDPFFAAAAFGPTNDFGFADEDALALFAQQAYEGDATARLGIVRELETKLLDVTPYFPLFYTVTPYAISKAVKGWTAPQGSPFAGMRQFDEMWIQS